jgi:hypothetical protein
MKFQNVINKSAYIISSLLLINFIIRLIIALLPLRFIDGLIIPDDAYISLFIAKNIAKGLGPHYGFGFTNGFQPLYVFLMVPIYKLFPNDLVIPVHIALIILSIFDTLSLYFIIRIISRRTKNKLTYILISLFWIFNPYIISTTLNGLETMISAFFIIFILDYIDKYFTDEIKVKIDIIKYFYLGILSGLAVFARIDNVFLVLIVLVFLIYQSRNMRVKAISTYLFGIIIIYLPWLVYSYYYTGDIYPVSGKACRFMSLAGFHFDTSFIHLYYPMMKYSLFAIIENNLNYIICIFFFFAILVLNRKFNFKQLFIQKSRIYIIMLGFSMIIVLSYTFYIFTHWYFSRYYFPLVILFLLFMATLIDKLSEISLRYKFVTIGMVIISLYSFIFMGKFQDYFSLKVNDKLGYMSIGLWSAQNFQPGTVIGAYQTGALAYFANNLKVINLDGVVNKEAYTSLVGGKLMEYIRNSKIEYILTWKSNLYLLEKETNNFKNQELQYFYTIQGLKSWNDEWYVYKVKY